MPDSKDIQDKILSTFAGVAGSIGYSPLHGKIIGVLLVEDKPTSLQELAKKTGYSISMVSLSLDFLEVLSVIKRVKKTADRKLYIKLSGDLLECLKKAFVTRLQKSISDSLSEFEQSKKRLSSINGISKEKGKTLKTMKVLEKEIKRLERYINILSKIKLP